MSKLIDLTGQDFGYWHVIERAQNDKSGKAYWLCHCTLCDKTTKAVSGAHLRGGRSTSCGCTKMEKMKQSIIKNEEGKTYGFLYVERMATEDEKPRKDSQGLYWNCTCTKCGKTNVIVKGDYLRNGDTTSCGCITSKNESLIAKMLDNLQIKYIQQYRFSDLTSNGEISGQLIFDFAIMDQTKNNLLYLIEYDGIQHFDPHSRWANGDFNKTHHNDILKNEYCFSHNIPLIRIPYYDKYNLNDLKLETTRFLFTQENQNTYYENYSNIRKD